MTNTHEHSAAKDAGVVPLLTIHNQAGGGLTGFRALADHLIECEASAWDEGHRAGCAYFPDCVEIGHHDANPYRVVSGAQP